MAIPEVEPIDELELLTDHVPPPGRSERAVVKPTHTASVPEILPGSGLMVTGVVI